MKKQIFTPAILRLFLIGSAVGFVLIVLIVPLISVFYFALEKGFSVFFTNISDSETLSAVRLTLLVIGFTIPLNLIFGIAASWAIAKFDFIGKNILLTLIDIPFSVSPVISGLIFILLFGRNGLFGEFFAKNNIQIIFATPGIVIATIFVTFPLIARELIPVLQSLGSEEEEAAITLGASGWQTFRKITLPKIKWGVLYGCILCNARALGEFGAVSVVSGHIQGLTNTIPLQVEILYNEYNYTGAFAVASILSLVAILTLLVKEVVGFFSSKELNS